MWLGGTGVVNHPSDGSQRITANHLAVHATGSGEAYNCPNPRYGATFVAQDAPLEMTSGEEAVVWIDLANDGNVTWDLDGTRIGTQDPQDRDSVFFKEGNWIAPNRATGADHSTYGPGSVGRFTWVMLAPDVEYTTTFQETFQAVQEGVTWFGPTMTMDIVVHPIGGPRPPPDAPDPDADPTDDPDPSDDPPAEDPANDDTVSGGCSLGAGTRGNAGCLPPLLLALALGRRRRG